MLMFNKDCTVYLQNGDTYTRHYIDGVHWEDTRGVAFNRTGVKDVDSVMVWIPFNLITLPEHQSGSKKHYIVRGKCETDISTADGMKTFLMQDNPLTITSITRNDFSFTIGDHWMVTGK